MRKFTYWLAGLGLIIIAIGAVLLLNNIRDIPWAAAENALCEPTLADAGGVDISSAFRFTFTGGVGANALRRFLSVEPEVELNFHQGVQAQEVLAVPLEPLQPGQVYRFSLRTESEALRWAFQTKQEWRVEASAPAYAATAVPPDSALEFYFNQSLSAELNALPEYFQMEPQVSGHFEQDGNCLRFIPAQPLAALTAYTVTLGSGLPATNSDLTLAEVYSFAFETGAADGSEPSALWYVSSNATFTPQEYPAFPCDFYDLNADGAAPNSGYAGITPQPVLYVSLYRYPDAQAYAEDILATRRNMPLLHGYNGRYPQSADTSALTRLFTYDLYAQATATGYRFSWPTTLPPGCYLLQANYRGQRRDIRFQISLLNAFLQTSSQESLFWVHTISGAPAAACRVTHLNSGADGQTDADGLLHLSLVHESVALDEAGQYLAKQDVYLLRCGPDELVLADFNSFETKQTQASADIWQYMQLSQDIYDSGDTLEFWGYMRRRDNAAWEWNRVSVYICAAERPDTPVLQGYAPLGGNIFHGSLPLPRLLPGAYELQIWQSGQILLRKGFAVNSVPDNTGDPAAAGSLRVASDRDFYALNEEYELSVEGAAANAGDHLFIKSGGGLQEAIVEQQARHRGLFAQEDMGGAYWQAVAYGRERYEQTPYHSLLPESLSHHLRLEAALDDDMIIFSVRDAAGNIPAKAGLLALIAPPGRPPEDMAAALYAPNRSSGLLNGPDLPPSGPSILGSWDEEAVCFIALEVDTNGRAKLELPAALPPGEWQLYAWAVADDTLPLAGSLQLPLGSVPADKQDIVPAPAAANWLFISSGARVQAVELLQQARAAAGNSLEERWAAIYAAYVLAELRSTDQAQLTDDKPLALTAYQRADGGIFPQPGATADIQLSLLAAALEAQGLDICDAAALSLYLKEQALRAPSATARAMALSGLAALGRPALQEIKLMLRQENLPPAARACLVWGLAQAGDTQVAKAALRDLLADHGSGVAANGLYLEDGEGDNILLNSLGTLAAAACGEARAAYAMLQYPQNRPASSPLTAALTAGVLLQNCYAAPAKAALKLNWRLQQVEIEGFRDFWLETGEPGPVTLDNVSGDLEYTLVH